jgi:hypothetical protein
MAATFMGRGPMLSDPHRLLVVIRFENYSVGRLGKLTPFLSDTLSRLSTSKPQVAFHSRSRDVIGYLIETRLPPSRVLSAIQSPGRGPVSLTPAASHLLSQDDSILVIESGSKRVARHGSINAQALLELSDESRDDAQETRRTHTHPL